MTTGREEITYHRLQPKRAYRIDGNTYDHRNALRSIGATFHDDSSDFDRGVGAKADKYWILDLRSLSNTSFGRLKDTLFKLSRAGCKFYEANDDEI